jgi:O-antigen/teichoic acid export membrane protein
MTSPATSAAAAHPLRGYSAGRLRLVRALASAGGERAHTGLDAITAFLVRVASAGVLYLTQVALARWMGAHDYGVYILVWTWVLVLGNLSNLGLSTAVLRLLPQHKERCENELLRGLLLGSRILVVLVASSVALAGFVVLLIAGDRLPGDYVLPAYLALVCIPFCTITDLQDGLARARGWMAIGLLPPYVVRPLLLLASMSIAHLSGLPTDTTTAMGAAVVACWGTALLQTLLIERCHKREVPPGQRRFAFAYWLRIALPFWIIVACDLALQNADVVVVSAFVAPAQTGMYFAAAKTMSLVMFIHYAIGSAVANKIAALEVRGDRERLGAVIRDAACWTFWPSLLATAGILLLGKPILSLFRPEFVEAYPVMCILSVGLLARASMGPSDIVLNMLGEQSGCARILLVCAVLNVTLAILLVPRLGMNGAAIATSTALAAAAAMNYALARRRLGLEISILRKSR